MMVAMTLEDIGEIFVLNFRSRRSSGCGHSRCASRDAFKCGRLIVLRRADGRKVRKRVSTKLSGGVRAARGAILRARSAARRSASSGSRLATEIRTAGRALETIALARADRPSSLEHRLHDLQFRRKRDPYVHPGASARGNTMSSQRLNQRLAPLRVGRGRICDQRSGLGSTHDRGDEFLQDMTDPARPQALTAFEAGDGQGIAGDKRHPQIRPE